MAASRFDGSEFNGFVLEQGGRLLYVFTVDMANPNATSATLSIRESLDSPLVYLAASTDDHLTLTNGDHSFIITVDIPPSVTSALTGHRPIYYYDLEVTFDNDPAATTIKYIYGYIPWRREPGGAG